jgi:Protein of unknown function (DUF3108)
MFAIMIIARSACLAGVAALLFVLPGAVKARAGEPDRVDARFEIFGFAGFHVLTNRTTVEEWGDRYAIAMDLDTRGLASVFVDLTSHSQVRGKLAREAARPETYRSDVRRNGADRHYAVDYRGDGTVIKASLQSPAGQPLLAAAQQMHGTVDQLTAYFQIERQLARGGGCSLVIPVFDGSGLYNLRFTDLKREALSADKYQNFSGPSQVCEVERADIVVNPDRNEDTYRTGRIWYARAGDRMMPVRMEYDTAFGVVKGYLAELRGLGVNLRLMKE